MMVHGEAKRVIGCRSGCAYLLLAFLAAVPINPASGGDLYTISVGDEREILDIEACFQAPLPETLLLGKEEATRHTIPEEGAELESGSGRWDLQIRENSPCVRYEVRLDEMTTSDLRRGWQALDTGEMLVTDASTWLWRRPSDDEPTDSIVVFQLGPGQQVSAPWPRLNATSEARFRMVPTPRGWPVRVALGRMTQLDLEVPGAVLRASAAGNLQPRARQDLGIWLQEAGSAVAGLYGRFPIADPQILVLNVESARSPVPFAQVLRGGGTSAHFYINPRFPVQAFRDDWTAVHELSHMLLPYVGRRDAWFSEGTASYYQNVLRSRARMISPELAWQKLLEGFDRGIKEAGDTSLREATRRLRQEYKFMQVYWGGAAVIFMADVEYRRRSLGRWSMDLALEGLADCCLPTNRRWSALEVAQRLDEITGIPALQETMAEYLDRPGFPDMSLLLQEMGIGRRGSGVILNEDAPMAFIARAIMGQEPVQVARHEEPALKSPRAAPGPAPDVLDY